MKALWDNVVTSVYYVLMAFECLDPRHGMPDWTAFGLLLVLAFFALFGFDPFKDEVAA